MLPQKILKFRVSEMPFPAFSTGHFLQINMQENVVFVCYFTHLWCCWYGRVFTGKKRPVTPSELWDLMEQEHS